MINRFQALRRQEDGQALVLCVVVLAALLGIASLAVDGGNALLQRRNQQGVADAAALAAVKELPASTLNADTVARDYATTKNSADGSTVDQVVVTSSTNTGTCDGGFGATTLAPASACVIVHTDSTGAFSRLFGIDIWRARARAIAQAAQVTALGGWLPLGVRAGAFNDSPPTQLTITPGDGSHNVGGMINTPAGTDCKFYGGAQIADVIEGAAHGGADACPITIGQAIQTQTGVVVGNITKGFDARIGSNTDSFSDVFGQDASGNYYVKKLDSPRLAVMPVAQDTSGNWPLASNANITVQGYVLVYIGDTTNPPSYPAYSGNGNKLKIYLTPVNVPLPDSWTAQIGDYSSSNPSPIVYRLVS